MGARRGSLSADAQPQEWAPSLFYQRIFCIALCSTLITDVLLRSLQHHHFLFPTRSAHRTNTLTAAFRERGQLQEHIHIHLQEIQWILYPVEHVLFMIAKRNAWENNCSDIPAFYQLNQGATFHVRHTWRDIEIPLFFFYSFAAAARNAKFLSQDLPDRSDWRRRTQLRKHSGNKYIQQVWISGVDFNAIDHNVLINYADDTFFV